MSTAFAELDRAVAAVVTRCLAVEPGEQVLVVCDPSTLAVGSALLDGVARATGDAALILVPPHAARGSEPPAPVAAALAACDVFLAPALPSLSHTRARKAATEAGARGATLPGVTGDLLGRLMSADLDAMAARSAAVAHLLTRADSAHVTCDRGTDLTLDLRGRTAIADDGDLRAPGAFGNLPCGEGFVSPVTGSGTIAASSLPTSGVADTPVVLHVEEGRLADAGGGPPGAAAQYLAALDAHGPLGRNLAELGVGTNEKATLTGNVLEDEKMLGTVHIAFGASAGIGGTVTVPVHLDVVVLEPNLVIGDTAVISQGRFLL